MCPETGVCRHSAGGRNQRGVGLPLAIFVLVVLSVVGVAVNRLTDNSQINHVHQVTSARAWNAAVSGAQLVLVNTLANPVCQCGSPTQTINFTIDGLRGCSVTVACSSFVVQADTYCELQSTASCEGGTANRTVEVRVK